MTLTIIYIYYRFLYPYIWHMRLVYLLVRLLIMLHGHARSKNLICVYIDISSGSLVKINIAIYIPEDNRPRKTTHSCLRDTLVLIALQ